MSASDGRNLAVAVVSGLVLFLLFVGSLVWHPAAFTVVVAALVTVGSIETARTFERAGQPVAMPIVVLSGLVLVVGAYLSERHGQVIGLAVLFVGATFAELAAAERGQVLRRIANTCFLGLWIGFLATYAVLLASLDDDRVVATLAVIGAAIVTDIGAYFAGTRFGRNAIAPRVSPNKTWEGLIGGLVLAAGLAVVVLPLVGDRFDVLTSLLVALVSGIAGVFGDLFESMFKRDLGVKDMGDVLPGHGGVLDRVDGILLALPVGYYLLLALQ